MRFHRIAFSAAALAALAACSSDNVTSSDRPPLAGVRFINALADTSAIDIKAVDQVEWSPVVNNLAFRAGTEQQPIEAKDRHFRVFAYNVNGGIPTIGGVSAQLLDTTITLAADSRVTLLVTGSARAKTVKFVMINDAVAVPAAGKIAVRAVNASTGAVDVYYTASASTAISGAPATANLAPLGAATYVSRDTGNVAAQFTAAGSTTVSTSLAGPTAPTAAAGTAPAAGVNSTGSAFSVYYFGAAVTGAGAPAKAASGPAAVWFVDLVPAPL